MVASAVADGSTGTAKTVNGLAKGMRATGAGTRSLDGGALSCVSVLLGAR
jgi:hypothetical protein